MLSIIIPTKNEANFLPVLLASIQKQTFKDYEIIVADNHSEDGTEKIARDFGARVVTGGDIPAIGRNRGAEAAQGEWLFFMDADTVLVGEDFLSELWQLAGEKKLSITVPWFFARGKFLHRLYFRAWAWMAYVAQFFAPIVGSNTCLLIKKNLHERIGGFNEQVYFGEDMDYLKRAVECGKFRLTRRATVEVSPRRLEKEGVLRMLFKATRFNFYYFWHGRPAEGDLFNYDFDAYENKK